MSYTCLICGFVSVGKNESQMLKAMTQHIHQKHNISSEDYYTKYINSDCLCPLCKKHNRKYLNIRDGFRTFCVNCSRGQSLEKFIIRHGDVKGLLLWNEYRKIQAYTNSYEYKKEKYGMTIEEFTRYNKSRAVTLDNMINRHGGY